MTRRVAFHSIPLPQLSQAYWLEVDDERKTVSFRYTSLERLVRLPDGELERELNALAREAEPFRELGYTILAEGPKEQNHD